MKFDFTPVKDIIEDSSYFEDVEYGLYCWKLLEGTNFNGIVKEYHPNGVLKSEVTYKLENNENDRVIYLGKANKYIHDRFYKNHLNPYNNFSTLRRAIGAVLKEELSLRALPKIDSKGNIIANKKKACRQYRFDPVDELKINQWMINNLEYGFIELDSGVDDIIKILNKSKEKRTQEEKLNKQKHKDYMKDQEKEAKKIIRPSLNCQSGDKKFNDYYDKIGKLRKVCRKEANESC